MGYKFGIFCNRLFLILCLGVVTFYLVGCDRIPISDRTETETYQQSEFLMGTQVRICLAKDEIKSTAEKKVFEEGFAAVRRIDALLSIWRGDSEISQINNLTSGQKIKVDTDTLKVLEESVRISQLTGGAFDVTVGPLLKLWGFGPKTAGKPAVPSDEQIHQYLALVGWQNIIIDPANQEAGLSLSGMEIDLGGIAKGYAVDKAVEAVKQCGVSRALIEAGGDIYCLGNGLKGKGWRVGLQHPRQPEEYLMVLKLNNQAVATSGDYENYFMVGDKRYSHIIDPRTGQTVQETPMSVSIIARDCTTADALATAVFVLGPEAGMEFVESQKDVEAVIISGPEQQLKIEISSGTDKYIYRN